MLHHTPWNRKNGLVPPPPQPSVIGVDVGGTKVAVAAIDGTIPREAVEHPTDLSSGEALLADLEKASREVIERVGRVDAVGIGMPSQIDFASGTVVASVNIPLAGVSLRDELSGRLGVPAYVDNDANVAALAEAHLVEGGPARHLVMLTLGTGVGGGVVIDGRIFRGASGLGAELGHVVIEQDGPPCPGNCPNRGCLEAMCSGTALGIEATEIGKSKPDSALGRVVAEQGRATGHDAEDAARAGDPDAALLFQRFGRRLGTGIASFVNVFEPEHFVIGGGASRAADLFLDIAVTEARSRALPALAERVTIGLARAGADAGVVGAGLLAAQELSRDTAHPTPTAAGE
jgi:glucokinase